MLATTRPGRVKQYPAAIESESDLYIIVSSARGMAPDNYHTILITVRFAVEENDFVIVVTKERWLTPGKRQRKGQERFVKTGFHLDGELKTTMFGWSQRNRPRTSRRLNVSSQSWKRRCRRQKGRPIKSGPCPWSLGLASRLRLAQFAQALRERPVFSRRESDSVPPIIRC